MAGAEIGIFGGSGFYSFLEDVEEVELETPYGKPSAPIMIGEIGGKRVAFLPRHGRGHELPPAQIPYRANVWAMKELGVRRIIGPNASGALKAELELGEFVVCDQFVDRTWGRARHLLRGPGDDARLRRRPVLPRPARGCSSRPARELGIPVRDGGTVVVDPGPALLDPRRVALVPGRGLGRDQHDGVPRGLPRARARALLREHLDGHRPRRRRRGRGARLARAGRARSSARTTSACGSCCSRRSRGSGRSRRSTSAPRRSAAPGSRRRANRPL